MTQRKTRAKAQTVKPLTKKGKETKRPDLIGNQFWKARSSHGRKPIFSDPEQLRSASLEYIAWVENNPLQEEKVFCYQGFITRANVSKLRAMTINGLCLFLDIDQMTWAEYRKRDGFTGVTREIEAAIYEQKFSGAAAEMLNANIIARELGLADKKELSGGVTLKFGADDEGCL
jgi:hypothetical protein